MLKLILKVASFANVAGGLVLIFTWATMWQRVPVIVVFIGGSLLIQGAFTLLYLTGNLDRWGDVATGALFAGEGLAAFVGAGGLVEGIIHNMNTNDLEMAPVLAGILMLAQALLALSYLIFNNKLRPQVNGRSSA